MAIVEVENYHKYMYVPIIIDDIMVNLSSALSDTPTQNHVMYNVSTNINLYLTKSWNIFSQKWVACDKLIIKYMYMYVHPPGVNDKGKKKHMYM